MSQRPKFYLVAALLLVASGCGKEEAPEYEGATECDKQCQMEKRIQAKMAEHEARNHRTVQRIVQVGEQTSDGGGGGSGSSGVGGVGRFFSEHWGKLLLALVAVAVLYLVFGRRRDHGRPHAPIEDGHPGPGRVKWLALGLLAVLLVTKFVTGGPWAAFLPFPPSVWWVGVFLVWVVTKLLPGRWENWGEGMYGLILVGMTIFAKGFGLGEWIGWTQPWYWWGLAAGTIFAVKNFEDWFPGHYQYVAAILAWYALGVLAGF